MRLRHVLRLWHFVRFQHVAWIGAAHVRAQGTAETLGILRVQKIVALADRWIIRLRREREGRAARPAADAFRSEPDHVFRVAVATRARGLVPHEPPEPGDILLELAIDDVRSVAAEVPQALADVIV